jgi:hypothetical protein
MFVDPSQMNFALQAGSPCHNTGCEGYDIGAVPLEDMPAAPPYFSVNTASVSDNDVVMRWVNPTTTIFGNPITTISAVHIWRNDSLIAEITDFSAGDTLEFTDAIPQPDYFRYYISATDGNGVKGWRLYSNEYWLGGPISGIIVWELDKTPVTGEAVKTLLRDEGYSKPVYVSKSTARYPLETAIDLVVVCLGIYPNNHVLTDDEGIILKNYLDSGGNVYMEGGDTWYFDPGTPVHPYFHINGTADGSDDLYVVEGETGTLFEGMHFNYIGENQWMDHIEPTAGSQRILRNYTMNHGVAVACEGNGYMTIGTAFEFGGLVDDVSPSTKEDLLLAMLEFFGIEITAIGEPPIITAVPSDLELRPNYPNPFNSTTTFSYGLPSRGTVELQVYDINGRLILSRELGTMEAGWHRFQWDGLTNQRHSVASSIYFYRFIYQDNHGIKIYRNGKLHLIR